MLMASSIFSTFCSVSLLLIGALISASFRVMGSNSGNMAMAIEEVDSMALLPFGSASGIGSFVRVPQCGGPRSTVPSSLAQDSPLAYDFVNAHNTARAQVGVGPVQWDNKVANFARQYANQRSNDCQLVHSSGPYGENIAWGSSYLSNIAAFQMWVDQKQIYNHSANSCAPGQVCSQYTQVVWRNSIRIGCAKVRCRNNGGTFIICNYDPRGNIFGQRPY